MTAVRPIEHEARLSVLEHVGELRVRLMIALAAFTVAFGFAFWQNHAVLSLLNRPLAHASIGASERAGGPLAQTARTEQSLRSALLRQQIAFRALALTEGTPRTTEQALATAASADAARRRGRDPRHPAGAPAGHTRYRRAVHPDRHRLGILRAAARAPDHPVAAIRVRDPRLQPA
jgi:sec-independent protein translocase protein TatC